MNVTQAKVLSIEPLTSFVYKLRLKPQKAVQFKAGQYLMVVMGKDDKRPFSIASAPDDSNTLELHIGASPENPYAFEVLQLARETKELKIEVGLGDAFARENDIPMIVIVGGTGYSYAKSIVYHTISTQPERTIRLYWGGKEKQDLYEFDSLMSLSQLNPHFTFVPVLENPPEKWKEKSGLVHQAVMQEIDDFSSFEIYTAGRFEMAKVIRDDFSSKGLNKAHLFGDAYAYI